MWLHVSSQHGTGHCSAGCPQYWQSWLLAVMANCSCFSWIPGLLLTAFFSGPRIHYLARCSIWIKYEWNIQYSPNYNPSHCAHSETEPVCISVALHTGWSWCTQEFFARQPCIRSVERWRLACVYFCCFAYRMILMHTRIFCASTVHTKCWKMKTCGRNMTCMVKTGWKRVDQRDTATKAGAFTIKILVCANELHYKYCPHSWIRRVKLFVFLAGEIKAILTPWAIKKGANLVLSVTLSTINNFNAVFTVRFRKEQHMWWHEFHPPHLINVATLPCYSWNTERHVNTNSAFNVNNKIAIRCTKLHWQFDKMFWWTT